MLDGSEHLSRARDMGICPDSLRLISNSYMEGRSDGTTARQSCLPLEVVKSNLIRKFLVEGFSGQQEGDEISNDRMFVELMARAYYDGFNSRVIERGVLSSGYFPLE